MSKPSNQELASLVDMASNLLARRRSRPVTFEELSAAREKIKAAVKTVAEKDVHNSQLHMLKEYKRALKIRMDVIEKNQQAEASR